METNYIVYFLISGVSFVFWVLSLLIWDVFAVVDELSGRRAKRQLKAIKASATNVEVGTAEELSALSQESLLEEELKRVAKDDFSEAQIKREITPIKQVSVEELEDNDATEFVDTDKTQHIEINEDNLSTGVLEKEVTSAGVDKNKVVVIKRLSNGGGNQ